MTTFSLRMSESAFNRLMPHLFPGDVDEHGAVLSVGVSQSGDHVRLLVRDVFLARDGVDYVPGRFGYRALSGDFVARVSNHCYRERLGYLAVHCHGGRDSVAFSDVDLASHRRGYPALLDITNGGPVGALVFAENAVAGAVWTGEGVFPLADLTVVGANHRRLYQSPRKAPTAVQEMFHRQSLIFGAAGQTILQNATVGIIGLGGVGSLVSEWLSHLGVGRIIAVDFDRIEPSNRSRVVGATHWDAREFPLGSRWPWVQRLTRQSAAYKVDVAKRVARRANPDIVYEAIVGNVVDGAVARRFKEADFLFLSADSAQSRLVFNALVHQYLIPGVQVGSKIAVDRQSGAIGDIFVVSRPVVPQPGWGCLQCNGLISAAQLQEEALSPEERDRQRYVDDPQVHAPSVITLNALAAGQAVNDFVMGFLGLQEDAAQGYLMHYARERRWVPTMCQADDNCLHCGALETSNYARGDRGELPCRDRIVPVITIKTSWVGPSRPVRLDESFLSRSSE
ncbi:MAG: ThiF family adenylyltransferase [Phycisphaerales bacterium]